MISQIIQFGGAALLGVLGTLAGLLLKSEIDRRAERRARRAALIEAWRKAVEQSWQLSDGTSVVSGSGMPITKAAAWPSLRGHLTADLRQELEGKPPPFGGSTFRVSVGGDPIVRNQLLDQIDQVERRWGLV